MNKQNKKQENHNIVNQNSTGQNPSPKLKPSAFAVVNKPLFLSSLEQRLLEIRVDLSDEQKAQMAVYYETLVETNKVMNLTGIVEAAEVAEKHIADSLRLLPFLGAEANSKNSTKTKTLVDVGTGAGLPGIPLAVACPWLRVILLDSQQKRCRFLETACQKLGLQNVAVVWGRAEELGHKEELREKADFAVARAVASLPILLEYLTPFVNPGGRIIAMKGSSAADEIRASGGALRELNSSLQEVLEYTLTTGESRSLVVIKKDNLLKQKYPRNSGLIKKKPL